MIKETRLIHDDVIDRASVRRNQPTIPIHYVKKWETKGVEIKRKAYDVANSMAICAGRADEYIDDQAL